METNVCRFSIDVEAGGDNPHDRALLEIGISVVGDEEKCLEVLFKPDPLSYDRHALLAIRRPIQEFIDRGVPLVLGINQLLDWVDAPSSGRRVEFVGLNMPYDWMFFKICVAKVDAVHTLPHKAYDIASYGAGVFGLSLSSTGDARLRELLVTHAPDLVEKHLLYKDKERRYTGLDDAKYQGRLLLALEDYAIRVTAR